MDSSRPAEPPALSEPEHVPGSNRHRLWVLGALVGTLLVMRMTGLMALPIFGDEAIYLRWAQLVRGEGFSRAYWWVSLADPKPPLHYWLLALVIRWGGDPLWMGRMLSVLLAAVSLPLVVKVCEELGSLRRSSEEWDGGFGWAWGLVGAILVIFCPFLAFHQRLASAESLFLCQSLLIVWLSLRWGRLSNLQTSWNPIWRTWTTAIALGGAIGVALMTRQGVSYTLCAMPVVGWFMHLAPQFSGHRPDQGMEASIPPKRWTRGVGQLALAAVIAWFIWTPYLTAELRTRALDNAGIVDRPGVEVSKDDLSKEVKRRVLYQGNFTETTDHVAMARRNFALVFLPKWNAAGVAESGWLYFYLTPVVYGLCLAGLIYLAVRQQWRVLLVLLAWLGVTLGPVVLLGNVVYSRYVLTAVPPLLIAGAFVLMELSGALFAGMESSPHAVAGGKRAWGTAVVVLLWGIVILWPLREMAKQTRTWWEQTLTAEDRGQYITGWDAGYGTQAAIAYIHDLAKEGPLVVVTDAGWGLPADATWVYLSGTPNISLYYTTNPNPILIPVSESDGDRAEMYRLRRDKWLFSKDEKIRLPEGVPVLYLTSDPVNGQPALEFLRTANPNLQLAKTFKGVEIQGRQEGESVALFLVSRPGSAASADNILH